MPKMGTFLFAEDVRDEGRGRFTAVGVFAGDVEFESVEDAELPRSAVLACLYDIEIGDHQFGLRVLNMGSNKVLDVGTDTATITKDKSNLVIVAKVEDLYFPSPGDHRIMFYWNKEVLAEHEFGVKIANYVPPKPPAPKKPRARRASVKAAKTDG